MAYPIDALLHPLSEREAVERGLLPPVGAPAQPKPQGDILKTEASGVDVDATADYGHAQVLAELLQGRYRWAAHRKCWMEYAGGVWRPIGDERMNLVASETLRRHYAGLLARAAGKEHVMQLASQVRETCILARIQGALGFLKGWPGFYTEAQAWDADPWALNCQNGVLDLRTGIFRPHRPEDLCTKQANVSYDPKATCPNWQAHLKRFLPSAEVRRQIQRALGVALVGAVLEERLDLWHGTGANGKSTTQKVLLTVLGNYAGVVAPNLLMASKYERHPTELADLSGYRVLFSTETEANRHLAEALVKQVTGGEPIKARFLYSDFFTFERTFSLTLITNHRPSISGQDLAIWRRIRLIPWTETIPPAEQRPQDQVVGELTQEGPGILNWLLEGLRDWRKEPHWTAPEVVAATDAYRLEQDALGGFLTDCCELGPRFTVGVSELYEAYIEWAGENGEEPIGKRAFGQNLKGRGMGQVVVGHENRRRWLGLRLKSDSDWQMRADASSSSITFARNGSFRKVSGTSARICSQVSEDALTEDERLYVALAERGDEP